VLDSMRVRAGGFTEAEVLALAWSKRNKEADLIEAKRPRKNLDSGSGKGEEKRCAIKDDRSRHKDRRSPCRRSEIRNEKKHGGRDSPNYSPYIGNDEKSTDFDTKDEFGRDNAGNKRARRDEWDRSSSRDRGKRREVKAQRSQSSKHLSKDSRSFSRSRSRSLTRFQSRSRSRSPRSQSPSRSRASRRQDYSERSRSRSPLPPTWAHDKFSSAVTDSPSPGRKRDLGDYRPPSPTWVSRAGGVAIMRKKSD
jgi:hypothetical protein